MTAKLYMGQIMAECDCSRQSECEAAQRCLAEPDPAADRIEALLADLAQGPMRGELMEPWIRRMMDRASALRAIGEGK